MWRGAVRFGGATATVVGTARRDEQGWLLEATGTGQRFRLAADPRGGPAWTSLEAQPPEGAPRLRITGEVREGKGTDLTLVVARLEAAPA